VARLVVWGGCCNHLYHVRPRAREASEAALVFDQVSIEADAPGFGGYRTAPGGVGTRHKGQAGSLKQDWIFARGA